VSIVKGAKVSAVRELEAELPALAASAAGAAGASVNNCKQLAVNTNSQSLAIAHCSQSTGKQQVF
jgi:hypothetical protein